MQKKNPILGLFILLCLLGVIGFVIFKVVDNAKKAKESNTTQATDTTTPSTTPPETVTPTPETPTTPADTTTDTTVPDDVTPPAVVATDFTSWNASNKSVGTSTNTSEYTLKSITDSKRDGYHRFVFLVQAKVDGTLEGPYVTAQYKSSLDAIRVDLNGITTDQSGIAHQKSRTIGEQGIVKIYHNVSADQTEELYDIGVLSSTVFKMKTAAGTDANTWTVTLDVKYPGGTIATGVYGSDTFSKDLQAIEGSVYPDNAKISAYSYTTSGGILTIIFNVSGTASHPIPAATAQYVSGVLQLEFTGLTSDSIYAGLNGKTFASGISITTSKTGHAYKYVFNGATKDFKLHADTSPNQVIMEIKL
jgi:hypothetical protein